MTDEKQKLIEDRNQAEDDLLRVEEEMHVFENTHEDAESHEEWNELHLEACELENWIKYLNACLEDYE